MRKIMMVLASSALVLGVVLGVLAWQGQAGRARRSQPSRAQESKPDRQAGSMQWIYRRLWLRAWLGQLLPSPLLPLRSLLAELQRLKFCPTRCPEKEPVSCETGSRKGPVGSGMGGG